MTDIINDENNQNIVPQYEMPSNQTKQSLPIEPNVLKAINSKDKWYSNVLYTLREIFWPFLSNGWLNKSESLLSRISYLLFAKPASMLILITMLSIFGMFVMVWVAYWAPTPEMTPIIFTRVVFWMTLVIACFCVGYVALSCVMRKRKFGCDYNYYMAARQSTNAEFSNGSNDINDIVNIETSIVSN